MAVSTLPAVASRTSTSMSPAQLVGQLHENGIASLEIVDQEGKPIRIGVARQESSETANSVSSQESSEEEDYDHLKINPQTVVNGGAGGGFRQVETPETTLEKTFEELKTASEASSKKPPLHRLTSIPITLKKASQNGKYFLVAEDAELKMLLKMGLEREKENSNPKRRNKFSDLIFTRQFTTFDRQNPHSGDSAFHGFFNLFWLATAIFVLQIGFRNWSLHGNIFGTNDIIKLMFRRDVVLLLISDGVLCGLTGVSWLFQLACSRGLIKWSGVGIIIQNVWQLFYTLGAIYWTLYRDWPWSHTVYFVLHTFVMLMKQHSYAFYNGYLCEAYMRKRFLEKRLKQLQSMAPVQTPGPTTPAVTSFETSYLDHRPTATEMKQRRHQDNVEAEKARSTDIAQVAEAVESREPLDLDQIMLFERIIKWEIDALTEDLKGKSTVVEHNYPNNLSLRNHYAYIVMPTLVYELEYPRSEKINWAYVAEKTTATLGVLFIMNLVAQTYIYPVVIQTIEMKEANMPLVERLQAFPAILNQLLFPFMLEYMMAWYIIWECMLNLLAELTYFADRGFYADWWNSISWADFARDWNRPVHNFLLRHVYHSSISSMRVNKATATLITFFLSALVHELVMWCLFKKLRGYLLFLQMMQLPLVQLSRSRLLKGHATLGNLMFWVGIFTGPSLLCSLYLVI